MIPDWKNAGSWSPSGVILVGMMWVAGLFLVPAHAASLVENSPFLPPQHSVGPATGAGDGGKSRIREDLEFRGFIHMGGSWEFSIFNKKEKVGQWFRLDESHSRFPFKVVDFDPDSSQILVRWDGEESFLGLNSRKEITPLRPRGDLSQIDEALGITSPRGSAGSPNRTLPPPSIDPPSGPPPEMPERVRQRFEEIRRAERSRGSGSEPVALPGSGFRPQGAPPAPPDMQAPGSRPTVVRRPGSFRPGTTDVSGADREGSGSGSQPGLGSSGPPDGLLPSSRPPGPPPNIVIPPPPVGGDGGG